MQTAGAARAERTTSGPAISMRPSAANGAVIPVALSRRLAPFHRERASRSWAVAIARTRPASDAESDSTESALARVCSIAASTPASVFLTR